MTPIDALPLRLTFRILVLSALLLVGGPADAQDPPINDDCADAVPLGFGIFEGDTFDATADGASTCAVVGGAPDVWYQLSFSEDQFVLIDQPVLLSDSVVSVHSECPGPGSQQLACGVFSSQLSEYLFPGVSFLAKGGETYYLRVAGEDPFVPIGGQSFQFQLGPGGAVTGQVTDTQGAPLAGIQVIMSAFKQTQTDDQGVYRLTGLSNSDMARLYAGKDSSYVAELWNDVPCPHLVDCPIEEAQGIRTRNGEVTTGIDFVLEDGATVTGSVREASTGEPLEGIPLTLRRTDDPFQIVTATGEDGSYRFEGLEGATYSVASEADSVFRPQLWDGVPCGFFGCDLDTADPIVVGDGQTVAGIDFVLDRGTSISGRVVDEATSAPVAFERIHLLDADGNFLRRDNTDAEGRYLFDRLNPGTYLVRTATDNYVDEMWPEVPCGLGQPCDVAAAETVTVELGSPATGIDLSLARGGAVEGILWNASTLATPAEGRVQLHSASGELLDLIFASSFNGTFSRRGLPPGTYYVVAYDEPGLYFPQPWGGADCESVDACDPLTGTPVTVGGGDTLSLEVYLRLRPQTCVPDASTLCLRDGRFAVDVVWSTLDQSGETAAALALPGIDDTGSFWFFDDENVEILVKVLDDCEGPSGRFWVFAGGLTDVLAQMTVTDTWTGMQQVYFNPLGSRFQPIQDTAAFNTCDAERPAGAMPPMPARTPPRTELELESNVDWGPKQGPCVPGETVLCLGAGGRFQVEAQWNAGTLSGVARVTPFTDDSGLMWFFDDQNVEVIVKVLDACDLFERFWVFAAGLTDVEVMLTVVDTQTGERQIYHNPLNTRFEPVQDVEAFSGCR